MEKAVFVKKKWGWIVLYAFAAVIVLLVVGGAVVNITKNGFSEIGTIAIILAFELPIAFLIYWAGKSIHDFRIEVDDEGIALPRKKIKIAWSDILKAILDYDRTLEESKTIWAFLPSSEFFKITWVDPAKGKERKLKVTKNLTGFDRFVDLVSRKVSDRLT